MADVIDYKKGIRIRGAESLRGAEHALAPLQKARPENGEVKIRDKWFLLENRLIVDKANRALVGDLVIDYFGVDDFRVELNQPGLTISPPLYQKCLQQMLKLENISNITIKHFLGTVRVDIETTYHIRSRKLIGVTDKVLGFDVLRFTRGTSEFEYETGKMIAVDKAIQTFKWLKRHTA